MINSHLNILNSWLKIKTLELKLKKALYLGDFLVVKIQQK
tara:strand:- start:1049 stop:1168 length:120 start_codon:yes stop_codon:yes gene_type:complete